MGEPRIKTCGIIGSGNVAWHLAVALSAFLEVRQVYSPNADHSGELARRIPGCRGISGLDELEKDLDLYLIAVKDDAVAEVIMNTSEIKSGIWAHTSGSVSLDQFSEYKRHYGVFYPLQTFSKEKTLDLSEVGFFIEGSDPATEDALMQLASNISRSVHRADSEMRRNLHVAAVFACNFVNYMWIEADRLLRQSDLDLGVMRPLLQETLRKLEDLEPEDAQTGPARRGDDIVIARHLAMLEPRQREVYSLLSDNIKEIYRNEQD